MTYEEARRRLHYAIDYDDLRPSVKEAIGIVLSDREYWKDLVHDCAIPGTDVDSLREQERDMRLVDRADGAVIE